MMPLRQLLRREPSYLTELLELHKTFYSWLLPLLWVVLLVSVPSSLPSLLVRLSHGGMITCLTQWLRQLMTLLSLRKSVIKTLPLCFCLTSVSVLNTVYNALQTTETMRNHMDQYPTSELRSQLKIVRRNMANSKEMYDSFVEQEKLLQNELNKRIAKAKNK